MARCGLRFLNDLDTTKAKETGEKNTPDHEVPIPVSDILDLSGILDLDDFDPDLAFWKSLDFISGTPQASQDS